MPKIPQPPILVCDIPDCESTDGCVVYLINDSVDTAEVILCAVHGEPVKLAHRYGNAPATRRAPDRGMSDERLRSITRR